MGTPSGREPRGLASADCGRAKAGEDVGLGRRVMLAHLAATVVDLLREIGRVAIEPVEHDVSRLADRRGGSVGGPGCLGDEEAAAGGAV